MYNLFMDKQTELLILENNELLNLSEDELIYLDEEALNERRRLLDRKNQLTKELQ